MLGKIRKCDHTGDSILKEYDTESLESVKVAQDELTKFLEGCVEQYGIRPPVWARRIGNKDFDPFASDSDSLNEVDEVIVQFPMVGG
jgi:hypothetical protein